MGGHKPAFHSGAVGGVFARGYRLYSFYLTHGYAGGSERGEGLTAKALLAYYCDASMLAC
ncbi:hypothetical protein D0911_13540 [Zhongshania marina]|uniref:Uncharacterized protein n=1 Tax=Zhongshania marina TaxID=2304603 RepID=A0ABX9W2A6_9GAMM|nr:hypothetical protein D0911_13540 [Zhongshania marina]